LARAYVAGMTAIRDRLEAHQAQMGWHLGLLPVDPVMEEVPGLQILTDLGPRQIELDQGACATYSLTEATCLPLIGPQFADVDPGSPGTWYVLALPFPNPGPPGPMLVGPLISSTPTAVPEDPAPADSVVLTADGIGPRIETSGGPARWFLVAGYTYLLIRDRATERWSIREIPNAAGNWAQLLPPT
jgi:hypothetical protein